MSNSSTEYSWPFVECKGAQVLEGVYHCKELLGHGRSKCKKSSGAVNRSVDPRYEKDSCVCDDFYTSAGNGTAAPFDPRGGCSRLRPEAVHFKLIPDAVCAAVGFIVFAFGVLLAMRIWVLVLEVFLGRSDFSFGISLIFVIIITASYVVGASKLIHIVHAQGVEMTPTTTASGEKPASPTHRPSLFKKNSLVLGSLRTIVSIKAKEGRRLSGSKKRLYEIWLTAQQKSAMGQKHDRQPSQRPIEPKRALPAEPVSQSVIVSTLHPA
eukprot:g5404.t1